MKRDRGVVIMRYRLVSAVLAAVLAAGAAHAAGCSKNCGTAPAPRAAVRAPANVARPGARPAPPGTAPRNFSNGAPGQPRTFSNGGAGAPRTFSNGGAGAPRNFAPNGTGSTRTFGGPRRESAAPNAGSGAPRRFGDTTRRFGPGGGAGRAPSRVTNGRTFMYHNRTMAAFRGRYAWPPGSHYQRWYVGEALPLMFITEQYVIADYVDYDLDPPPPQCEWVQYGPDLLLVNDDTGAIEQTVYGAIDDSADQPTDGQGE